MKQPKCLGVKEKEDIGCRLKKSLYNLNKKSKDVVSKF